MKKTPYTAAVEVVHAPAFAVEEALRRAADHTNTPSKISPFPSKRLALAAAFLILTVSAFIVYGIFVAPTSRICLNSRESVTVTLNSRGNVLSAADHPALTGASAADAVAAITRNMLDSDALDENENTLLIGLTDTIADKAESLTESVTDAFRDAAFDGCLITLTCDADPAAALIDLLRTDNATLTREDLRQLSVNDLCLLFTKSGIRSDSLTVTGSPSENACIGFDSAAAKALSQSKFSEDEMSGIEIIYSVYHGRLVYLVRLRAGDDSEAYFINAATGATEEAIKAPTKEIDKAIENAVKSSSPDPIPTQAPTYNTAIPPVDPTSAPLTDPTISTPSNDVTDIPAPPLEEPVTDPPTASDPPASPPTLTPAVTESAEYRSFPVTLTDLSFITLSPPETAASVSYTTLFEGQYIEPRGGEKINTGEVALINNESQMRAFLQKYNHSYTDKDGRSFQNTYDTVYFKTHFLLVSACTVSDASYYTTVTDLSTDGATLYMENSLTYGVAQDGETYCHTLSLYELDRKELSSDQTVTVY